MLCGTKAKKFLKVGREMSPQSLRDLINSFHSIQSSDTGYSLKIDEATIGQLMEKFEVYSEYDGSLDLEICHARQFKDMIGVLGNFFIGERMFEVVLKMSIFHERKVE